MNDTPDAVHPAELVDDFLVVALGASAGGISALRSFFEQVAVDSGMAYVVILHLSPKHDSELAHILQRVTAIPVILVEERVQLEPDRVYVIPPDRHLTVDDGHLDVADNLTIEDRRAPVDILLRSLADDLGPRAVAVVLSGSGANGSMGLKRVKEHGGAVFVQDPTEAEFDEMIRHALGTGLVDGVQSAGTLAARIAAYAQGLPRPLSSAEQKEALSRVLTELRLATGHDFSHYKQATLVRRIRRRVHVHGLSDIAAYAAFLSAHPPESPALLKDLLISVTSFFRDAEAFAQLDQDVIARLMVRAPSVGPVRIWVAGCATGEEAYSLAMLCAEHMQEFDPSHVQIFATDLDQAAIAKAREGLYTLNDAADVSPERLRRFFRNEGDGYRVRREIRDMVLFALHNLIQDPPFSHLDLISCRNLLIYLEPAMQARVMRAFHFALNPGAHLFIGASESIDTASQLYATVSRQHHIFQSRSTGSRALPLPLMVPSPGAAPSPQPAAPAPPQRTTERISFGELHQQLLERYAPPSLVIDEEGELVHLSERAGDYLQLAGGEPTRNIFRLIRPELRVELRSALYQAVQRQVNVEVRDLSLRHGAQGGCIHLHVRPVFAPDDPARGFVLVLFERSEAADENRPQVARGEEPAARHLEEELQRLKSQLRSTLEQHETQTEEFRAANEELQAMNEELRLSGEEIKVREEELQSVNEELTTLNQELRAKVDQVSSSGNNLRNLIDSVNIATLFLDRAFRVNLFTPAARQIFNLLPVDLGRSLAHITNSLEDDRLQADADQVLQTLQPVEREVRTTDGRFFDMRVLPYRTAEDQIQGVVVTFVEISRRKQAEDSLRLALEALRESEARLRKAIEIETVGVVFFSPDGRITDANDAFLRLIGRSRQELAASALDLASLTPPPWKAPLQQALDELLATGRFMPFETRLLCADDSQPWVLVAGARLSADDAVAYVVDVSSRKDVEVALRTSQERLRLTVESVGDYAIVNLDTTGRIQGWNAGARQIFGYDESEAVGQPTDILFTPEDRAAGAPQEEMRKARDEGRAADERWHIGKGGRRMYLSGVLTPLRADGQLTGFVKIARDLTTEKSAEESLRRAHEELEERVHERTRELAESNDSLRREAAERREAESARLAMLRQLVNALENERRRISRDLHDQLGQQVSALRVKLSVLKNDARVRRAVRDELDKLDRVVQQLDLDLDFLVWELRPTALDDLGLAAALSDYVDSWSRHFGIAARLQIEGGEDRLPAEIETVLYRTAQEALNNIVKHANASSVQITIEPQAGEVQLSVEDNGSGFDPLQQLGGPSRGIGLLGMRERAMLVGGSLVVDSRPGGPTRLTVRLPVMRPAEPGGTEPPPSGAASQVGAAPTDNPPAGTADA